MGKSTRSLLFSIGLLSISIVSALAQPVYTIQNKKDACDGIANGSFEILVSSGTGTLTAFVFSSGSPIGPLSLMVNVPFAVSGLVGSTMPASGGVPIPGGTRAYTVIVSDDIGSDVQGTSITNVTPNLNAIVASSVNNADCSTPSGSIDITVSGGTGSYAYVWTGPAGFVDPGTQDLVGLSGGSYSLTVSDDGTNCSRNVGPIVITDPSPIAFSVSTTTPLVCLGTGGTLNLANSEGAAVSYQVYKNGAPTGIIQSGVNSPLAFAIPAGQLTPTASYTFTIEATNGLCAPLFMTGSGVITVNNLPTITLGANPTVCSGIISTGITYSATSGAPNQFRIDWDAAAEGAGLTDVALTALPASPIPINNVPVVAGTYNGTLFVRDSGTGCESAGDPISVTVVALPSITLGANPSVCIGTTNSSISYSATTGTPDQFRIDWDAAAEGAGLTDVALTALPASPIPINNVPVVAGTYNGILFVRNSANTCESLGSPISVTVTALPTITLGANPSVCSGTTSSNITYSATTGTPDQFRIDWDGAANTAGLSDVALTALPASPIPINNIPVASGTYNGTLFVSNSASTCESVGSPISVTVEALPTITLGTNPSVCIGTTITDITYSATSGIPNQFRIDWDAVAEGAGLTDVALTALPASPIPINNVPVVAGTYNGTLFVRDSGTGCESAGDPISVTVVALPTITLGANPSVCIGTTNSSISYSATTGMPDQFRIDWDGAANTAGLSDVALTALPASPIPINNVPVVAGTYNGILFVRNSANTCESLGSPISVTVTALPTITLGANPSVCSGTTSSNITYSATTGTPNQFRIDWDAAASTAGLSDVALTALPVSPIPINNVPLAAGTYNGTLFVRNSGTGCESIGNPISVTVEALPTITLGTNPSVCIGTTITDITYSATSGTPNQFRIDWDAVAEGAGLTDVALTALPASPIPINNVPVVAGTYNGTLFVRDSGTGCESAGDPISVTVVALPTITLGANPSVCIGTTTSSSISYSATTGTPDQFRIDWDVAAEGAGLTDVALTALPASPIPINNVPAVAGTYNGTLFVNIGGLICESAGNPISVTVLDNPTITLGANPTVCTGTPSTSISYSATTNGPDQFRIDWDAAAQAAGLVDVPPTALPPGSINIMNVPINGGTYNGNLFVINSTTTCESAGVPISVTVQQDVATISGDATVCGGTSSTLTVNFSGPGPTWNFTYTDGSSNFNLVAGTNPFNFTVIPIISTTYTLVSVTGATCGAGTVNGSATVTLAPIAGNPATFGNETWLGYAYDDSGSPAPPTTNIDFNNTKYRGFIDETEIAAASAFSSYNTATDAFDLNLSNTIPLVGPNICGSYLNDYSIRFRMTKTFTAGIYTFTVGADDGVRMFVDGGANILTSPANSFDIHTFTTYTSIPQCLAAGTHDLVIEYFDRGGFSRINFDYTSTPAPAVTTPVSICVNSPAPTLTASSPGALDFNWYTDAALTNPPIFVGANYTPAAPELDMTITGTTDFFVTAVYACGETPSAQVTVDITNGAVINLPTPPVQVCDIGGMIDLTTLVSATPLGGTFTFAGSGVTVSPMFDPTLVVGTTTISVDYSAGTCMASTTFDIEVVSNATIMVPGAATACESSGILDLTTIVSGSPAGGAFTFAGAGVTGSNFDPTSLSGAVSITVDYSVGGCNAPTQMFDLTVVPNITMTPVLGTTSCPTDPPIDLIGLLAFSPTGGVLTFSGAGVSGNSFDPSTSVGTTANITADYDLGGCLASTTIQIVVRAIGDPACGGPTGNCASVVITPVPSPAVCSPTDGSVLFNINPATPAVNNTGVTINIVGASAGNQGFSRTNFNDPLFTALPVGTYDFSIEYGDPGCIKTGQVTVLLGPDVVDFAASSNNANCFGSSGGVVLSNINGSDLTDYTYEVFQLGGVVASGTITQIESLTDVTLTGFGLGDFEIKLSQDQSATTTCPNPVQSARKPFNVIGSTANLDTLYVTKTISVPDLPTGSMLVGVSESLQEPYEVRLELVNPIFPGQVFAQDFTTIERNTLNLKFEFNAPNVFAGEYLLSLRDALGCQKDYAVSIGLDTNLSIPNVFTPNGDGVNEVFFIRNIPESTSIVITNRWGNEVFSSTNYENDWNGGSVEDGVYFYRVSTPSDSYSGWIEVMRGQ